MDPFQDLGKTKTFETSIVFYTGLFVARAPDEEKRIDKVAVKTCNSNEFRINGMPHRAQPTPARIWFRFLRLHQRGHAAMSQRLRALGLSVAQFDLLSTLTESEGITQRDLAERLYVTKGNVSGLVDRLVEAGMVDRRAIPGDRRSYALHLTAEGRKAALAGMEAQQHFVNETVGQLAGTDIELLDNVLSRWRDTFKALEQKPEADKKGG